MPDLNFQVTGVEPVTRGLTPWLHFKLSVTVSPATETVQALLLHAQIQIQSPQRSYSAPEKERLIELFGPAEDWGRTLRNRLWTHTNATAGAFTGATEMSLPVPCTYDLNIAAAKYFYALENGEVPLLFLFSGSLFYSNADGRLQVERISWNKECVWRLPIQTWRDLMEQHYPESAWLYLPRHLFDQLYAFRRQHGFATWEQTIERLLEQDAALKCESTATFSNPQSTIRNPQSQEVPA
jgi:hypothetical protein